MNEDEVVPRLQKIGLNLYESRAYLALLSKRQISAKVLGQTAIIPQSRTYDVLESLTAKGFAMSTPSSPKLYTPIPMERVLPSYYAARKEEIQRQAMKVHQEAQRKLDVLTDAYDHLMEDLKDLGKVDLRVPEPVWVVEGRENIERTIISLVQDAKKELMRITRPPDLRGNSAFDPFYIVGMENRKFVDDARRRKVNIRWLSLTREVPSYPGLNVREPTERRYLERDEDISEKFFLADSSAVLLNLYDPRSSAFGSIAMLMKSEAAFAVFKEHFEAMWERAKPLSDILPRIRDSVTNVCTKMKDLGYARSEVVLYKTLAEIGADSEEAIMEEIAVRKVPAAEGSKSLARLIRAGFVHRNTALRLVMVESPSNVLTSLKDNPQR